MKVLNIYASNTGNTEKVAKKISDAVARLNFEVDTLNLRDDMPDINLLDYDFIFAGSGVYGCMPSKGMMQFLETMGKHGMKNGDIKPCSPRIPFKYAIPYCTYGGVHTGVNEAIPCIKNIGQVFDHYGFEILDEWCLVGAFNPSNMHDYNVVGRLGDITGRPNEVDLNEVFERTKGILNSIEIVDRANPNRPKSMLI